MAADVPPRGLRVLLLADDGEPWGAITARVRAQGHAVVATNAARAALRRLGREAYDLVVVDLGPPARRDLLLHALRERDRLAHVIPAALGAPGGPAGVEDLLCWIEAGLRVGAVIRALRERERAAARRLADASERVRARLHLTAGYSAMLLDGAFGPLPAAAEAPLRALERAAADAARSAAPCFLPTAAVSVGPSPPVSQRACAGGRE